MRELCVIGGTDRALPDLAASPLGDALNAVAAAALAAIRLAGPGAPSLWPLQGRFGLARNVMPAHSG